MVLFKSYDSITLILFVPILIGTAVNSICLGTCSSFFKLNLFQFLFVSFLTFDVFLEAGAKVQLLFNLARFF